MMKLFRESELPNQEWVLRLSVGGIAFLKNDWAWLILDVPRPVIHGCHRLYTVSTYMDQPINKSLQKRPPKDAPTALRNGEFRVQSSSAENGPDSCTRP